MVRAVLYGLAAAYGPACKGIFYIFKGLVMKTRGLDEEARHDPSCSCTTQNPRRIHTKSPANNLQELNCITENCIHGSTA